MLDTNMASAMIKGVSQPALRRLAATSTHDVAISVITEAELLFGLAKNPKTKHAGAAREFLATVAIMPWSSQTAATYAQVRSSLEAAGTPLQALDTLIAAHAKALGSTLVTDDKAFCCVEGLVIENWLKDDVSDSD
jgi:tRNA(fMet)-specific endonuclease VapC